MASWAFIFIAATFAADATMMSSHLLGNTAGMEVEVSCAHSDTENVLICKLTTFSVERIARAPGGVCPFQKISEEKSFEMSSDANHTEAHGSKNGDTLIIKYSQNRINSVSFSGHIKSAEGVFEFSQAGKKDPCEEYLKELLSNAANKLPAPGVTLKHSSETSFDRHSATKQQSGVGNSAPNANDPNLGNQ